MCYINIVEKTTLKNHFSGWEPKLVSELKGEKPKENKS
jgi:hypothetical protein